MLEVDPQALGTAQWEQVGSALLYLWALLFFMGGVVSNFIIAHAVIPSLVTTRHIASRYQALRLFFYGLTVVALAFWIWSAVSFLQATEVLRLFYPKVWQ